MTYSNPIKVSVLACLLLCLSACQQAVSKDSTALPDGTQKRASSETAGPRDVYGPPKKLGVLSHKEINESSGIVSSRSTPGLYWTHNDSGGGPFIYAIDSAGAHKGVWRLAGVVKARDWEGIAVGPGPEQGKSYLYIGDIGDNRGARAEITVYRVPEPVTTPADANSTKANPLSTSDLETIRLRYPDGRHDAETMMVHPVTGNIYIVTKIPFGNPGIYEAQAPLSTGTTTAMVRVGELSLPGLFGGLITDGSISPDGLRVALCDYVRGYELVLPNTNASFNEIWKQPLKEIDLGERKQGEAIGYRLDGRALLATSEGRRAPLIQVVRR